MLCFCRKMLYFAQVNGPNRFWRKKRLILHGKKPPPSGIFILIFIRHKGKYTVIRKFEAFKKYLSTFSNRPFSAKAWPPMLKTWLKMWKTYFKTALFTVDC